MVAQYKTDGLITAAERDALVARLDVLRDDVKKAEAAMKLGDVTRAENLGNAARAAIILVQKELAAKAKGGK